MKRLLLGLIAGLGLGATATAAPAATPEQLLPADVLAMVTVPDVTKARGAVATSAGGRLWEDPAVRPFRDKFLKKLQADVIAPLEENWGVKFSDYAGVMQGQFTLAVLQEGWEGKPDQKPGLLLLLDARDKRGQLQTLLGDLKRRWGEAGRPVKIETIRSLEFMRLSADFPASGRNPHAVAAAGPESNKSAAEEAELADQAKENEASESAPWKFDLWVGQSESLLVVGSSPRVIEQLLARQSGEVVTSLAGLASFAADQRLVFHDTLAYGWVHMQTILSLAERFANDKLSGQKQPNSMLPAPEKALSVTGLKGLRSLAFGATQTPEGTFSRFHLGIPESSRAGLFKVLVGEPKDTLPPAWVPADVVKYTRWRISGRKLWIDLEAMIQNLSPQVGGLLQMSLAALGKDKDATFDFRKSFIENLGDDVVSLQKAPRAATLEALNAPPSMVLISSTKPGELASSLKALTGLMPVAPGETALKERKLGDTMVYSFGLPGTPGETSGRAFHFAAAGGYLALSMDRQLLEQYVGGKIAASSPLRDLPGLARAAQKAGGTATGLFGYENYSTTVRLLVETLRQDPQAVEALVPKIPWGESGSGQSPAELVRAWLDFSLLPPFDQIAKYFHFSVYAGVASAEGLTLNAFAPTPPQLGR
jgi:hypothetical protein